MNNNSHLKIYQLNVNSLISQHKRTELNNFLKNHKPDVLLLNETKLNSRHNIQFKNYNFVRNDRPNNKNGGGTGILIKKNHTNFP